MKTGMFCEVYGKTAVNAVLEFLLENQDIDFAVGDIAKEAGISRPKAYSVIEGFEKKGFVKKSRFVGKTQLYILNRSNSVVKLYLRNFKECLKAVLEEYGNVKSFAGSCAGPGCASAKNA